LNKLANRNRKGKWFFTIVTKVESKGFREKQEIRNFKPYKAPPSPTPLSVESPPFRARDDAK